MTLVRRAARLRARTTMSALTMALATTALVLPAAASAATVGSDAVQAKRDSNAAGSAEAFKTVATTTATVDRLNVYLDASNTASKVELGLYSGASKPDAKLGSCVVSSPQAGWNSCSMDSGVRVTEDNTYWSAVLQRRGTPGIVLFRDRGTDGPASYGSASGSLTSLPATYRTGTRWPSAPASIYADRAAADAPTTLPPLPPTPIDTDGDGIPDLVDQCPSQPGPAPTGCPPPPPPPADSDGDGVPDSSDKCPNQKGPSSNQGCPTPPPPPADSDGDGVPDSSDNCPNQAGPSSNHGCPTPPPPTDSDGDGVPDSSDNCPNQAGPSSNQGCPTPPPPPSSGSNCMPNPSACGFPDLETTGVTPGTQLTNASGVVTLSTPGQVYENKKVTGQIVVTATNVTIRNVKLVMTSGDYGIKVTPGGSWSRSDANLTLDHVEIDMGGGMDGKAIAFSGYTVKNTFFHNGADCAHFGSNVVIQDSLCVIGPDTNGDGQPDSTGFCSGPSHFDGFQDDGGGNFAMRHNTVRNPCGQTSAMLISDDPSDTFGNISVTDNLMAGGGYTLYCPNTTNGNVTVTGNRFGRTYFSSGGMYGPTTYCNQADTYSGNVWDDTGKTV